jgi:hypothetical protein
MTREIISHQRITPASSSRIARLTHRLYLFAVDAEYGQRLGRIESLQLALASIVNSA